VAVTVYIATERFVTGWIIGRKEMGHPHPADCSSKMILRLQEEQEGGGAIGGVAAEAAESAEAAEAEGAAPRIARPLILPPSLALASVTPARLRTSALKTSSVGSPKRATTPRNLLLLLILTVRHVLQIPTH